MKNKKNVYLMIKTFRLIQFSFLAVMMAIELTHN